MFLCQKSVKILGHIVSRDGIQKDPDAIERLRTDLDQIMHTYLKVFRIILEFRILRLTFHRKPVSK